MKKKIKELTDEEAYAIENGDEITDGNYPPTYDEVCMDDLLDQLYGLLEGAEYSQYLVDRHEKAEVDLRTIETLIIESIGEDSYKNIMDLLILHRWWLEGDIEKSCEEYENLNHYFKNYRNSYI